MNNLEAFLDRVWDAIKDLFTEAEHLALTFLSAAAQSIAKSGGALLVDAARTAVQAAEASGGTGQEKFDAAVAAVTATLENAGVQVITNAVRSAIEAAVAEMREATQ